MANRLTRGALARCKSAVLQHTEHWRQTRVCLRLLRCR